MESTEQNDKKPKKIIEISDARQKELYKLLWLGVIAGGNTYSEMKEDYFNKYLAECEEKGDFTRVSAMKKIRANGPLAFEKEIEELFSQISLPVELEYIVQDYNFGEGMWVLYQIIKNKNCALDTAQNIYWLMVPYYYYDNYFYKNVEPEEGYNKFNIEILKKIEEKARKNLFVDNSQVNILRRYREYDYLPNEYPEIPKILREVK